jgi:hypothetical protein
MYIFNLIFGDISLNSYIIGQKLHGLKYLDIVSQHSQALKLFISLVKTKKVVLVYMTF